MALIPFRWAALAVAGMLLVTLYAMKPPKQRQATPFSREDRRLQVEESEANARAHTFGRQLRMLQVADSVRVTLTGPTTSPVRLVYGAGVSAETHAVFDSIVAEATKALGPTRVGIDVAVVSDTATMIGPQSIATYGISSFQIFPSSPTQRCVNVVTVAFGARTSLRNMRTEAAVQQVLGACRYYAAFGMPSDRIQTWMRGAGVALGYSGSWTRAPAVYDEPTNLWETQNPFAVRRPGVDYLSGRAIECMGGVGAACDSAVAMRMPSLRILTAGPVVGVRRTMGPTSRYYGLNLGSREDELVAGMVRTLGRDRFAQFWTSNDPVPVAFERASGVPLASWVNSWITEQYGAVSPGPSVDRFGLFAAFAMVVLAVGITIRVATNRQFT